MILTHENASDAIPVYTSEISDDGEAFEHRPFSVNRFRHFEYDILEHLGTSPDIESCAASIRHQIARSYVRHMIASPRKSKDGPSGRTY